MRPENACRHMSYRGQNPLRRGTERLLSRSRPAPVLDGECGDDLLDLLVVGLADHPLGLRALYFFPHRLRVRRPIIGGPMCRTLKAFDPLLDGGMLRGSVGLDGRVEAIGDQGGRSRPP